MAGLRGELARGVACPTAASRLRFPAAARFPRERHAARALRPERWIDPAALSGGPGDPILYQALKLLRELLLHALVEALDVDDDALVRALADQLALVLARTRK
jgi:hypothetical protein